MALLTTLKIKDVEAKYKVVDFRCHFARHYNQFNPDEAPACERIEMTVVAPDTDDFTFYEWFINGSLLSGELCYELPVSIRNVSSEKRTIAFADARCFAFSEDYDINSESRRTLKVSVVPQHVTIDQVNIVHL